MPSMIQSIIALALTALLTFVGVFYMNGFAASSNQNVTTSQVLNSSSQIKGAVFLFESDHAGQVPASFDDLTLGGYLKQVPQGSWAFSNGAIQSNLIVASQSQCLAVNQKMYGSTATVPLCTDTQSSTSPYYMKIVCCSN